MNPVARIDLGDVAQALDALRHDDDVMGTSNAGLVEALLAEVRRLRDQVAELEALRRADITVIGHLGVAVPRAEAERNAALAQVAAARRALLQGGQLAEIRCRAALVALDDGRG